MIFVFYLCGKAQEIREKQEGKRERNGGRGSTFSPYDAANGGTGSGGIPERMPDFIREDLRKTYYLSRLGSTNSCAVYYADDGYGTIMIRSVYEIDHSQMDTGAGSFEIVTW